MKSSGSFQITSKGKISLHAFGQCFQSFIDTALQKPENRLKNYPLVSYK